VHRAGLAAPALPWCWPFLQSKSRAWRAGRLVREESKGLARLSSALILSIGIHIARDRVVGMISGGTVPSCPANILRLREVAFSGGVNFRQMETANRGALTFRGGAASAAGTMLQWARRTGDGRMWTSAFIIASLASMALADRMARVRGSAPKAWFWIAFAVGPLAPFALLVLGERNHEHPARGG
jgi:hypothetical protein